MTEQEKMEKVIKGLECCLAVTKCGICPYNTGNDLWCGNNNQLLEDAISLLKARTPHVMTLDEVLALKFDDVVYVEVVPTHAVLSAIVLDVIPKLPKIGIGVVQFRYAPTWNGINNADLSYYDKTWRCWTSRPTDEQREATAWKT